MCLSVQGKVMMQNRHHQGFRLASLPLVLLSQPVLCPLMPEGLGMAFLAVFLAVSHGAWHLVEFSKYLWTRFLPILLFVVSNSKGKQ